MKAVVKKMLEKIWTVWFTTPPLEQKDFTNYENNGKTDFDACRDAWVVGENNCGPERKEMLPYTAHAETKMDRMKPFAMHSHYIGKGWSTNYQCPICGKITTQADNFLGKRILFCNGPKIVKK